MGMRTFRIDGKNRKILLFLNDGTTLPKICNLLQISRFNLADHLKTLTEHGYLQKQQRGVYQLTAQAVRAIMQHPRLPTPQLNIKTKRLHALGLKYPLKVPLSPSFKVKELAYSLEVPATINSALNNTDQAILHIGITARLTSQSLILYAPELYYLRGQPSIVAEARAKELLDKEALQLEKQLNEIASRTTERRFAQFKLQRIKLRADTIILVSEIVTEEIADEGHALAEASSIQDKSKIVLARHPYDKKERLVIDASKKRAKGVKELECTRAESAGEDTDKIDPQFNAILDGKLDLLLEQSRVDGIEQHIAKLTGIAENQEYHNESIRKLIEMLLQRPPQTEQQPGPKGIKWN